MKRNLAATGDLWAGLGLMVLGAISLYDTSNIFLPPVFSDTLGPRALPTLVSGGLILLGAVIALRGAWRGGPSVDPGPRSVLAVVGAAMAVYALAFLPLGYLVATTLFLAFLFFYLGERRLWLTAVLSVGLTTALFLGFGVGLHVRLSPWPLGL